LTYKDGVPEQTNFHAYEGSRLYRTPVIEVRATDNGSAIRGIGEPPVPPAAPALANAIFAARAARSCGLIWPRTFGWRPKASVVPTLDLHRSTRIDPSAFDRGCAGTVITFSGVGFNERSVSWRQHAGNSAGLSRACVPHQRFR
jgi:hypothetical protein